MLRVINCHWYNQLLLRYDQAIYSTLKQISGLYHCVAKISVQKCKFILPKTIQLYCANVLAVTPCFGLISFPLDKPFPQAFCIS